MRQPAVHLFGGLRVEHDDRAAAVGGILATLHETVQFELRGQLARRGQGKPERRGDLTHRLLALGADMSEHGHVAAPELRFARDQFEQLRRRPAAPEAPQHLAKRRAELVELAPAHRGNSCSPVNSYHLVIVSSDEERR